MPFRAVASQRLYEQVAEQVAALVARGEFKPGDRLPPERDLAKALGVSRPIVREAMVALEIAGVVEVRVGAGTFVTAKGASAAQSGNRSRLEAGGASPLEVVAARRVIEPQVAAIAARSATPADIQSIAETLEQTRTATDTAAHRAADQLFHVRIAAATRNGVLTSIVDEIWGEMFSPMFERLGALSGLIAARCSPQARDQTLDEHQAILRAIEARDADAAHAAMDRHLAGVEHILAEGETVEAPEPVRLFGRIRAGAAP